MAEEVVSFDLERSILDENEIRYTLWGNIYLLNIRGYFLFLMLVMISYQPNPIHEQNRCRYEPP